MNDDEINEIIDIFIKYNLYLDQDGHNLYYVLNKVIKVFLLKINLTKNVENNIIYTTFLGCEGLSKINLKKVI
jgi:hypothetical protein